MRYNIWCSNILQHDIWKKHKMCNHDAPVIGPILTRNTVPLIIMAQINTRRKLKLSHMMMFQSMSRRFLMSIHVTTVTNSPEEKPGKMHSTLSFVFVKCWIVHVAYMLIAYYAAELGMHKMYAISVLFLYAISLPESAQNSSCLINLCICELLNKCS